MPDPCPSSIAIPPTARATAVCSPLGSPGTYTRRPNAIDRVYSDLARADLPAPMIPAITMFGAVIRPRWYSTHGSNTNADPEVRS